MQLLSPTLKDLRKQLRSLDRTQFNFYEKEAGIGGGQDMPFEQAFANLAHAYLQDKAPGLQDYEVGFQLIDRNQENTKAVGVFGFKVGSQWLYAPVFFLNGDLKGHELLYIKNQDLFVPMKENWLNYLLNRKPSVLGEGVDKNLGKLGVLPPNLYQLSRSPAKYASAKLRVAKWAEDVLPDLAHFAVESPLHDEKYAGLRTIVDLIKDAGSKGVKALVRHCVDYPTLHEVLVDTYGANILDSAVKEAAANERFSKSILAPRTKPGPLTPNNLLAKKAERSSSGSITVITYKKVMQEPYLGEILDDKEKKSLIKGDVVIKDKRDPKDVTVAYNIQTPQILMSPDNSGLYDVLVKPGDFKKCLVIKGPYDANGRKTYCLVIDVENKSWITTHPSQIWIKNSYAREEYDKWFEKLSDGELNEGNGLKVLLGPTGQGTLPFRIYESNGGDVESYDVNFMSHAKKERPVNWPLRKERDTLKGHTFNQRIVCTEFPGKSLRAVGDELIVPKGYKILKLDQPECGCGVDSDPPAVLDLASSVDIEVGLIKSGYLTPLDLRHSGSHVYVDGTELLPQDALINLVVNKGLAEKQARELLDEVKNKKTFSCFLKFAGPPYELQRSGPSAPPFPEPTTGADPMVGGNVPTQSPMEHDMPIPDMAAHSYDRSGYDPRPDATTQPNMVGGSNSSPGPDRKAVETAMQAAQSGQKEVFDTAMLGSLLKSVRDDSMVDKYMGDLMKGMDRLARILFMLYWHMDEFEERYGKQDLPELEDGLRNAFESMGDIVLFLKQKTIEPYPEEVGDVDLKSVAGG